MQCLVCQFLTPDGATICASCGSPLAPTESAPATHFLAPRTPLRNGAFTVEEPLGAGGFGLTYRAREGALGREVAIKEFFPFGSTRRDGRVLSPTGVSGDDWARELKAFREEALTLARFSHPAIVRAYAVWGESGTAYFAMEFLRGQSLQKRLDALEGKPLPVDEALSLVERIGEALEQVHEMGLLHRDIKPDNILECDGRAVLIDFGTAREFTSDKTTPMTQLLTPGYAPLEQYGRRARFGPFTDVYALAATLYHALSGYAPPPAPDRAGGVELRPLDELNPRVSKRLARAIEVALEISVSKRPQTVGAWIELLRDAQKPLLPPLPVVPATPVPVDVPAPLPRNVVPATPVPATPGPSWTAPAPRPVAPSPSNSTAPFVPEVPADAKVPLWFRALVVGVPLLLLGFWWFYDPSRSDLTAFDARVRPVLALSNTVQSSLSSLDGAAPETFRAAIESRVVPAQQQVVDTVQQLAPDSEEARFSRDQLLDSQTEKLAALQELRSAQSKEEQQRALDLIKRAGEGETIWRTDYDYLLRQHRVR